MFLGFSVVIVPMPKIIQGVKFIGGLEIAAKFEARQAKFAAA